jgi:hypothetical protein
MSKFQGDNWLLRVQAAGIPIYGDINYRGESEPEDGDLMEFFNGLKYDYPLISKIAIHTKNEGKRETREKQAEAKRDKMKGALLKGTVDVIIPGCPSFVMELKRKNYLHSKIDDDQILYMQHSKRAGAFVCVCLGYDAAFVALDEWLKKVFGNGAQLGLEL